MGDPSAVHLPDLVLAEIFVRLPSKDFHRCRCLSRAWAAALSSDDLIDRHLSVHGKIRLHYDDVMTHLVFECSIRRRIVTELESLGDGETSSEEKESSERDCEVPEENENGQETPKEDDNETDDDDDFNFEEECWREEYRTKGYVEAYEDYYTAMPYCNALWEKAKEEILGIKATDSNDYDEASAMLLKACTVPYGALHPRIRQPFLEEDPSMHPLSGQGKSKGHIDARSIRGRERTEEEVDQEIIAFLRRLRDMDPQAPLLREFDTYQLPPIPPQGQDGVVSFEEGVVQEDGSDYSDNGDVCQHSVVDDS
ncbi:hypothetical protein CFC21_081361 [Triticum aestivum]|uniref:F-box domain-containing protein n=2 Tax=Triticum aestivum TaxID=4565 RepID=A0A9R1I4A1_WHEAT|nr:uncharacterized protein LOC123129888 [Triticum aestivum]KAF7076748.1 hypothetical protein CFC21_081361 [Triticum aestivum]